MSYYLLDNYEIVVTRKLLPAARVKDRIYFSQDGLEFLQVIGRYINGNSVTIRFDTTSVHTAKFLEKVLYELGFDVASVLPL